MLVSIYLRAMGRPQKMENDRFALVVTNEFVEKMVTSMQMVTPVKLLIPHKCEGFISLSVSD